MDLLAEFEALVVALGDAGVPHAVCGGLAVNVHGHVRATMDFDLLAPGLIAMKRLAGRLQDLADIEKLEGGDG